MIKADERREEIAEYVIKLGQVRIDDLVEHFGVSRMTIHRHIDRLAQQGVLRKLHGAVTVQPSGLYESAFRYRVTVNRAEKDTLARAALDYVEAGQVVMLDDSSTANAVATLLLDVKPLTVITNSVATASLLTNVDDIDFICLGGKYHGTYNAYIGIVCENAVAQLARQCPDLFGFGHHRNHGLHPGSQCRAGQAGDDGRIGQAHPAGRPCKIRHGSHCMSLTI